MTSLGFDAFEIRFYVLRERRAGERLAMRQEHYKCREAIDPTMDPPGVQITHSSGSRNSLLGAEDDDEGDAVRAIAKHIATSATNLDLATSPVWRRLRPSAVS